MPGSLPSALPAATHTTALEERGSGRGGDAVIAERLDAAKAALVAASSDFQRLRIRDEARAVAAAAAILKRRDIEVEASLLGADAEREIINHNPPLTAHEGRYVRDNPGCAVALERRALFALIGSNSNLRAMRRAHANLDDDEYERLKAEHRTQNRPMSRLVLLRRAGDQTTGRRHKPAANPAADVPAQPEEQDPPPPSRGEQPAPAANPAADVPAQPEEQDPPPPSRGEQPAPAANPAADVPAQPEEQDPPPPSRGEQPAPAAAGVLQVALSAEEHKQLTTIGHRCGWSVERAAQQAIRRYIKADLDRGAKSAKRSAARHPQNTKCRGCGISDRSKMTMGGTYCADCWDYAHGHGGVFPAPGSRSRGARSQTSGS